MTYFIDKGLNCGCNDEIECGCEVKDLGTKCSIYDGTYLPTLNVLKGIDLTTILKIIDSTIKAIKDSGGSTSPIIDVVNIGSGSEIFKSIDILKRIQLRSINSTGNLVEVQETDDEILIGLNESELKPYIKENGKDLNLTYSTSSTVASQAETPNSIDIVFKNIEGGDNISIDTSDPSKLVISAIVPTPPDVTIQSDTLEVTKTGSTFNINVLDDGVKKFYVNNLYTGTIEEGTESRPFKTIGGALTAYIGTGTYLNPQYMSQKAKIIIKRGNEYTFAGNFLINGLDLFLQSGAKIRTTISNGVLIDFDSLPSNVGKFRVNITGEDNTSGIILTRGLSLNTGYSEGTTDNTWYGRNLTVTNIIFTFANVSSITVPIISTQLNYYTKHHNNNESQFVFDGCIFHSSKDIQLIHFANSIDNSFKNSVIRFNSSSDSGTNTTITPMFFGGYYTRFENCQLVAYDKNTLGAIRLKRGNTSEDTKIEFTNCAFEGTINQIFTFDDEVDRQGLIIQNATSLFQNYGKVIGTSGDIVTTATVINSYFTSPQGDVDLTKNNTISVTNYFQGRLAESLLKSPTRITTEHPIGTPYIFTNGDSTDKNTWRREVVFS